MAAKHLIFKQNLFLESFMGRQNSDRYVWYLYVCAYVYIRVHVCTHACVIRWWCPVSFLTALHFIFWGSAAPWSWSSLIWVDWLVDKSQRLSCLCHLQLGLQVHMHLAVTCVLGLQLQFLVSYIFIPSTYKLSHFPFFSFWCLWNVHWFLGERLFRIHLRNSKSPTHSIRECRIWSSQELRTPVLLCCCTC